MSEDDEKVADEISELAKALATAHVRFIDKHRKIDHAAVMTATSLFTAIIVDSLSYGDDDPTEEEVMTTLTDITKRMLVRKSVIRNFMVPIIDSVVRKDQ
jgi:hypothetical protein